MDLAPREASPTPPPNASAVALRAVSGQTANAAEAVGQVGAPDVLRVDMLLPIDKEALRGALFWRKRARRPGRILSGLKRCRERRGRGMRRVLKCLEPLGCVGGVSCVDQAFALP